MFLRKKKVIEKKETTKKKSLGFSLLKKKEVVKIVLEDKFLKKIKILKNKEFGEESIANLNDFVRKYICQKYKVGKNLTNEEMIQKLEKKRIPQSLREKITQLLQDLSQREYSAVPSSPEDFSMILKFTEALLIEFKGGERGKEKEGEKDLNEKLDMIQKEMKLDWSNKEVVKIYNKVKREYNKLDDEKKKEIYPRIVKIFKLQEKKSKEK